jgi:hypothetical protein
MWARLPKKDPQPVTKVPPRWQASDTDPLTPASLIAFPGLLPVDFLGLAYSSPRSSFLCRGLFGIITSLPHCVLRVVWHSPPQGKRYRRRPDWSLRLVCPPNDMQISCRRSSPRPHKSTFH